MPARNTPELAHWWVSRDVGFSSIRNSWWETTFRNIVEAADLRFLSNNVSLDESWRLPDVSGLPEFGLQETLKSYVDHTDELALVSESSSDKSIREPGDHTGRLIRQLLARLQRVLETRENEEMRAAQIDRSVSSVLADLSIEEVSEIGALIDMGSVDVGDVLERLGATGLASLCLRLGAGDLAWLHGSTLRRKAAAIELSRSLEMMDGRHDVDGG